MTIEVSGTGNLWNSGPRKNNRTGVALTLPQDLTDFYNLRPGMFCKFTLIFPEKHNIIEADEVEALVAKQKELKKIDKFAEERLRKWYNDMKEIYERGKNDRSFKVPDHVRKLFEDPDELEKAVAKTLGAIK